MSPVLQSEALPPLYAKWIDGFLGPIPRESRATCGTCVMQPAAGEAADPRRHYFDRVIKCCTYLPTLYNFLVGLSLGDQDPSAAAGRVTVERRVDGAVGVTPMGLMQTPTFALLYQQSRKSFGKARALKCPHYMEEGGRCGVWSHRESTCATWFCKHVRGETSYTFWRDRLHNLLQAVELGLARWCVLEELATDTALSTTMASCAWKAEAEVLSGDALDDLVDREAYAKLWGEWCGREREFFIRCGARVQALSWNDVLAICGPEARAYARLTQEAYAQLNVERIPEQLRVGTFELIDMSRGIVRLRTYSEYDPIEVPVQVLELLSHFDGRPTAVALEEIARDRGVALEPALIQKMVDFTLLVVPT